MIEIATIISIGGGVVTSLTTLYGCYYKYVKKKPKKIPPINKYQKTTNKSFNKELQKHRVFMQINVILETLKNYTSIDQENRDLILKFIKSLDYNLKNLIETIYDRTMDKYVLHTGFNGIIQKLESEINNDFFKIRIRMFKSSIN
tara:strand:+ start:323 stop:757 length:435 start_codon:yes stop_codon:yes gene_type:complete